jgi:arsenate reductase
MKVYGIDTCQTYQKALKWFDQNNMRYEKIDYRKHPLSADEIQAIHEKSGLPIKRFFNTSGKLYQTYQLKEKQKDMSLKSIYDLLSKEPMLIKRPLVVDETIVVSGFQASNYETIWKKSNNT